MRGTRLHSVAPPSATRRLVLCGGLGLALTTSAEKLLAQPSLDAWVEDMTLDSQSEPLAQVRHALVLDVDHLTSSDLPGMGAWRDAVEPFRNLAAQDQIAAVNDLVNTRITYMSDWEDYHVADHWALLSETLLRGAGDCEDLAVAKLETLAYLGWDPKHLALMVGYLTYDTGQRAAHAVGAVLRDEDPRDPWVLGNVNRQLHKASERSDFEIIYAAVAVADAPEWIVLHMEN